MLSLVSALAEGRLVELPSTDKDTSLKYLAHLIEAVPDVPSQIDFAEEILRQEHSVTSAIGAGVACPHVLSVAPGELLSSVGWSPEGIDYGAPDGKRVHLVVMYLIPEREKHNYLKEISSLAEALQKAGDIQSIARAENIGSVREHLLGWLTAALLAEAPRTKTRMIQLQARQRAAAAADWALAAEPGGFRSTLGRKILEISEKLGQLGALVMSLLALAAKLAEEERETPLSDISPLADQIERLEDDIDTSTLGLIALHHPLGSDIRFLYVVPKIVSDLGRIGGQTLRLAAKIAKFRAQVPAELKERLKSGIDRSRAILRTALEALSTRNADLAEQVLTREAPAEDFSSTFFREIVSFLRGHRSPPPEAFSWSLIPHHLERIAHYSRTLCEDLLFWLHGVKVRHHHDEGLADASPSQAGTGRLESGTGPGQ